MSGVCYFNCYGSHIVCVFLSDVGDLIKGFSCRRCRCRYVVQSYGSCQTSLVVFSVRVILDFFAGDDLANVHAGFLCQLHGLLAGKLVTSIVEGEKQYAVTLVGFLHGLKYQLSRRSGEYVAHYLNIEHAFSYESGLSRLVSGTSVGDYCNAVGVCKVFADHEVAFNV